MEVRQGINSEIGIKFNNNLIDYQTEFIPKYRDVNGQFEGVAYRSGPPPTSGDAVAQMTFWYHSKAGTSFLGFDVGGKGDGSGDPKVDDHIKKAQHRARHGKTQELGQGARQVPGAEAVRDPGPRRRIELLARLGGHPELSRLPGRCAEHEPHHEHVLVAGPDDEALRLISAQCLGHSA